MAASRHADRNRGRPLPKQGQVAILLAIATGLPDLADERLTRLATQLTGEMGRSAGSSSS